MNNDNKSFHCVNTYTGKIINPLNLKTEDICLEDIAHALALKCRFNGHCRTFYSIAQHCYLAAYYSPTPLKKLALLHDAAEAYLFDIPRPLKQIPCITPLLHMELCILDTILGKYLLPAEWKGSWEQIDDILLIHECRALIQNWEAIPLAHQEPTQVILIIPWTWEESEKAFLQMASKLELK